MASSETIDIHFGISWLLTKREVENLIEGAQGVLINGRKFELFRDENRDSWTEWGESRYPNAPWHLVVRVEHPEGLSSVIIYRDYLEFEAILSDWMNYLKFEGEQLKAVITDSDDWSTYRGGRARNIPA